VAARRPLVHVAGRLKELPAADTLTGVDATLAGAAAKATPVDADTLPLTDSAASSGLKKLTWANLKAALTGYFDTLYIGATTAMLRLTSGTDVTLTSTGHAFQIGSDDATNLAIDNNEIQARINGAASTLVLNGSGGRVTAPTPAAGNNAVDVATTAFVFANTMSLNGELGNAVDLDTILAAGVYHQGQNTEAAAGTNYPEPFAGMLEVFSTGSFVYQRYTTYPAAGTLLQYAKSYWRARYTGAWTPWKRVVSDLDLKTVHGVSLLGTGDVNVADKGIFYPNDQTLTQNHTVVAGTNAGSWGPITVDDGDTVTVENGAVWTIA
jgi:hypothetical protein